MGCAPPGLQAVAVGVVRDVDEDVRVELGLVVLLLVELALELLVLIEVAAFVEDVVDLVLELVIVTWKPYQALGLGSSP